jgi:hypothetical protein
LSIVALVLTEQRVAERGEARIAVERALDRAVHEAREIAVALGEVAVASTARA